MSYAPISASHLDYFCNFDLRYPIPIKGIPWQLSFGRNLKSIGRSVLRETASEDIAINEYVDLWEGAVSARLSRFTLTLMTPLRWHSRVLVSGLVGGHS